MTINLNVPDIRELKPRITVFGVGGAGGNAVNNMITAGLQGVEFVVANTDAQALTMSKAERIVQMGTQVTQGLGAGSQPDVGAAAAQEVIDEIRDHLSGANMVFVTAGMGGGTGTGAAPVIAKTARDMGILTVGVVTKPFHFEGQRRMRTADTGIAELHKVVDTLLIIPNQNLFRVANEKTTFADAFAMADQVLYSGVACITDLMVKEGLINLDFADVRAVMREMGKAMMGTGEASGEKRALTAAEAAIANPLIDDSSMKGARGLLISITGGRDLTLFEVDEAATRIREEVDQDANIIVGATFDETLDGVIRVSVVATGIEQALISRNATAPAGTNAGASTPDTRLADLTARLRADNQRLAERAQKLETANAVPAAPGAPRASGSVERAALAAIAGGPGGAAAARVLRRRHRSPDRAEAVIVPGCGACRNPRACDARHLHSATSRARTGSHTKNAEIRRLADAGSERDPAGARRSRRGASAKDPDVATATPCQCRAGTSRRRYRAADCGPRLGSANVADAADPGAQASTIGRAANRGTGIGICPAARSAGIGRSRPPGTCCSSATGRRSFGYPGVPAAPGNLKFVTIPRTKKVPAFAAGTLVFGRRGIAAPLIRD
jgi:cell division protein FtsZ